MAFLGKILGNYADQSFDNMVPSGTSATALPRKSYQWSLGLEIYPPEGNSNSDDPKAGEEETSLWENAKAWGEEALFGSDPPDPNKFQDISSLFKRAVLVPQSVQLPQTQIDNQLLNQYNRKRIIQTGVQFTPVTITFYDTRDNPITMLIMQYLNYYWKNFRVDLDGSNKDLSNFLLLKSEALSYSVVLTPLTHICSFINPNPASKELAPSPVNLLKLPIPETEGENDNNPVAPSKESVSNLITLPLELSMSS